MRQEQRSMASKAAELEMEINEHRLAADVPTSAAFLIHCWFLSYLIKKDISNNNSADHKRDISFYILLMSLKHVFSHKYSLIIWEILRVQLG